MSKTDLQLKQDIEDELASDPRINAAQIAVSIDGGAVSLFGAVDTYVEKWAAEEATKRVAGVRTVAQDLTVKVRTEHQRDDPEIAAVALSVLRWNVLVPGSVKASVEHGVVTLTGQVAWNYQRDAAERSIRALMGVVSVFNDITLEPGTSASQLQENVQSALQRHALADARSIRIDATGSKVTLTGSALSWSSIDDAVTTAWAAPGVTEVVNHVTMAPRS